MMYPFLTLNDDTEIVHSEMLPSGEVRVYIERPDARDGFHSATCFLPSYTWKDIDGFAPEEIAEYLGCSEERVREIQKIAQDPVSLDTPIGEEEDSHLGDFLEDTHASSPQDQATTTMLKEELMSVLETLTPRE